VAKPVVDAFLATPESLPSKIVVAKKAIATRLTNVPEPDEDERQALRDALRALRVFTERHVSSHHGRKSLSPTQSFPDCEFHCFSIFL
jgi:hypothetical protein